MGGDATAIQQSRSNEQESPGAERQNASATPVGIA
jgi:hypothetical protein